MGGPGIGGLLGLGARALVWHSPWVWVGVVRGFGSVGRLTCNLEGVRFERYNVYSVTLTLLE